MVRMIESVRDAKEFVARIGEFSEFDAFHHLTTGESRDRLSLYYAAVPGLWERTTVYITPDGTPDGRWTSEYASVLDEDEFLREEVAIQNPVLFVWTHRAAVNEYLMLHARGPLAERLYGRGA